MTQLRKKSIIRFADITTPQSIKEMDEYAETRATYTLQEFLLSQTTQSSQKLFHSVESRGKNGYLVIYKEHLQATIEEFFHNFWTTMENTFQSEFVENYFNAIQSHLEEIDLTDDNSAISTFSAAKSYYQSIKSHGVSFTPDTKATSSTASSTQSGTYTPCKHVQSISLGYGDDVSSLGSLSAPVRNAWDKPPNVGITSQINLPIDNTASIATLKSEVQGWFEELKNESKTEWDKVYKSLIR